MPQCSLCWGRLRSKFNVTVCVLWCPGAGWGDGYVCGAHCVWQEQGWQAGEPAYHEQHQVRSRGPFLHCQLTGTGDCGQQIPGDGHPTPRLGARLYSPEHHAHIMVNTPTERVNLKTTHPLTRFKSRRRRRGQRVLGARCGATHWSHTMVNTRDHWVSHIHPYTLPGVVYTPCSSQSCWWSDARGCRAAAAHAAGHVATRLAACITAVSSTPAVPAAHRPCVVAAAAAASSATPAASSKTLCAVCARCNHRSLAWILRRSEPPRGERQRERERG
jgi:hypothetical protein